MKSRATKASVAKVVVARFGSRVGTNNQIGRRLRNESTHQLLFNCVQQVAKESLKSLKSF
jgi:hypothetical protein